jgi:hypothetical protein
MEIRDLIIAYLIGTMLGLFTLAVLLNNEYMYEICTWFKDECFYDPTWLQELLD